MAKKEITRAPGTESLLVELLTEELPPKSLSAYQLFADLLLSGLLAAELVTSKEGARAFVTPCRIAALIPDVLSRQPRKRGEIKGPPVAVIYAPNGDLVANVAEGFARKCGVSLDELRKGLKTIDDAKGAYVAYEFERSGQALGALLPDLVEQALAKLPAPKRMRWGDGQVEFVRPVHGLIMLHGSKVIPGTVFGIKSGNRTRGHRFLSKGALLIRQAADYEQVLEKQGKVIASFARRREVIVRGLDRAVAALGGNVTWRLGREMELVDEVTSLVEFPSVCTGRFDEAFLGVPRECLVVSMQQHQRYFPIADAQGKLISKFLVVANVPARANDPVVHGNERVLRARLADAKFFYDQDRRTRLEARVPRLAGVVYHNKLGSQLDRVQRMQLLSGAIARKLGADVASAERAAWLSKADLLTDMVGEFPELQGIMGRYYALHDGEPGPVADAIEAHYQPRFAGDAVPDSPVGAAVALADKLDTLAGLFGIFQVPSGDKDPFGMRRAALGIIRILVERDLALPMNELISAAFAGYNGRVAEAQNYLETFIFERLSGYLRDRGYSTLEVDAVVSLRPALIHLAPRQLEAVRAFNKLPEAESLAAANKRVVNILKQAAAKGESFSHAVPDMLKEDPERNLFNALRATSEKATRLFGAGDFTGYLKSFAVLKAPVDAFFDSVMVMVDDPALRRNRLALLADLRKEMNRVADISRLAA